MNNTNMYKMVGNFHDADILGMEFLTVNSYFDTINIVLYTLSLHDALPIDRKSVV